MFIQFARDTSTSHLVEVVKDSTHRLLILKKIIWVYLLTSHQVIYMFYDIEFLMKVVDATLKQNKFNNIDHAGFILGGTQACCDLL